MSLTLQTKKEIQRLLSAGERSRALEYVRDTFNVSTEDANKLVEAVEQEMTLQSPDAIRQTSTTLTGETKTEVEQLLRTNQKIRAVKYIKNNQRISLKRALELVEEVQKEIDPNFISARQAGGCFAGGLQVLAIFFFFGSLLLLGGAGLTWYFNQEATRQSELTEGTVISLDYYEDGSQSVAPVIAYRWQDKEMTYHSRMFAYPPAYHVGETVQLFVNRENPEDVIIDSFADRWLVITILASIGGFLLLLAIIMSVFSRNVR